jgi:hypothetical protein
MFNAGARGAGRILQQNVSPLPSLLGKENKECGVNIHRLIDMNKKR